MDLLLFLDLRFQILSVIFNVVPKPAMWWLSKFYFIGWSSHGPTRHKSRQDKKNGKITDYEGTVTVTVSSWDCQKWPLETAHKHKHDYDNLGDHNFCGNLKGSHIGVWCYTSDPGKQWENCLEARWLCIKPAFRQSQVILETPPSPYMYKFS